MRQTFWRRGAAFAFLWQETKTSPGWIHISSDRGEIEKPNTGGQQTSATVFDIDKDGVNDFVITERTEAPSVVWYRHTKKSWARYILEASHLTPEAGSTFGDVDLDFISGSDSQSNEVWWWEKT